MKKSYLYISAGALTGTTLGAAFFASNIFFAFANTGITFQALRIALLAFVLAQLVTNPPRGTVLRVLTGLVATVTGIGTIAYLVGFANVGLLDVFVLLYTAIALGITALELGARRATYDASALRA